MSPRQYSYVGPPDIQRAAMSSPPGTLIQSMEDLIDWLAARSADAQAGGFVTATFVVDPDGVLRLAPRRSEHIACAGGGNVLSAGEITFTRDGAVVEVSNQSTGFCPEPESWPSVAAALDRIPLDRPDEFTIRVLFRLCPSCEQRNIVKDGWFVCQLCGADLPAQWNFPQPRP